MSEETKTEIEEEVKDELAEIEAEIEALGNESEESKVETEEEKAARIEAEKQQENETDEERVAREKVEADAAAEETRVAALSEEEKVAEKAEVEQSAEEQREKEESEKERNKANANARHKIKELEKKVAEYEKKPDPEGDAADKAVDKLVKVWESGEGDEAPLLGSIRKASSQELTAIYNKAVAGKYRDHGEDVIKAVTGAMTMVKDREERAGADVKATQEALVKEYEAEVDQAKTDYPDYADDKSDAAKAKVEFDKNMLGTLDPKTGEPDGTGALPEVLVNFITSHPYVHHQLADQVFKASLKNSDSSKATVAALTKERDGFKSRLAKYEGTEAPPGAKSTDAPTGGETAEDIEKEILKLTT